MMFVNVFFYLIVTALGFKTEEAFRRTAIEGKTRLQTIPEKWDTLEHFATSIRNSIWAMGSWPEGTGQDSPYISY